MADYASEDPRISDLIDAFDREFVFIEVVDREFVDQDVFLDGRFWDRCTFVRCRLISRLGVFRMGKCTIREHRGIVLNGPALRWFELAKASERIGGGVELAITGYRGTIGPIN